MKNKYTYSDVSFVLPSRSNLKYLKWSYDSIRKNISANIWICMADDASTDNTWGWMQEIKKKDSRVKILQNPGTLREGHCILYDSIINKLVETEVFIIAHADMYWLPNSVSNMLKHMNRDKNTVVSATRIEPALHPQGPEKHIFDMGLEPEEFKEQEVIEFAKKLEEENKDQITDGVFAPWGWFADEFRAIGGHQEGLAPQSKEDSQIFNRMVLYGCELIQARDSLIAHLTCRGSRFNPQLTTVGVESKEWLEHNQRSTRNFIREWGTTPRHTPLMKPIIAHKFDIGITITNCSFNLLSALEPYCNDIYTDIDTTPYYNQEQPNTKFDLTKKLKDIDNEVTNEIIVEINGKLFNQNDFLLIQQLPDIITDSGEIGMFDLGNLKVEIKAMNHYEKDLIVCSNTGWRRSNHK